MAEPKTPTQRARRGYLIMAGLFLAAVVIFNADALADLTRDHLDLVVLVPRAEGIRVGSAVWVAGVETGRVTRIGLGRAPGAVPGRPDSAVVSVDVRVDARVRETVTRASDVRATRLRFIGQPVIQIYAGDPGDPPVRDGDTLVARPRPDPMAVLERGKELPGSLDSLFRSLQQIQESTARRAPELDRLTRDVEAVTGAAADLSAQMEGGSLERLLDPEAGLAPRVEALQARIDGLRMAAERVMSRYAGSPDGGDGPASPDAVRLSASVESVLSRVERLEGELETLQARLGRGTGFLVRVQRDSALQVAVRGVQAQIDSLTAEAASIGLRMLLP